MLLSEAFDLYRRDVILFGSQSPKTEESHSVCMRSLIKFTGDIELSDLTFDLVRDWKTYLDKNRSPMTVRCYIIKLRVVLKYLNKRMRCLDPELIQVPKRHAVLPKFLSPKEVTHLIDSTGSIRARAIIALLYSSGIRVSELCSLNRHDIRDGCFTVVGKGGKARLCFYDERAKFYIDMYLKTRDDSNQALFISRLNKKRITRGNVQEIFRHLCRKNHSKETISPHWLRHSFATQKMAAGMHIYTLSRLLGHSSIQTTQAYLHISDKTLHEEYMRYHRV